MVNIKINNQALTVSKNTTILEACKEVGIKIPTLCFLKDINEINYYVNKCERNSIDVR